MRYRDIPRFINAGHYEVNVPLTLLASNIARWQEPNNAHAPLDLLPDFQRGHVWTPKQQVAYVEFFLQGGATGRTIYLNCPNWGSFYRIPDGGYKDFVIVDGLQRLTALLAFVRGEIPAFGHYVLPNGCSGSGGPYFEGRFQDVYAEYDLRINVNNLKTKKDVLTWYLQMNSGGTPHTLAELDKVRLMIAGEP
jgi:uncharacterized protein with ParB-like and HNH nuclease domain